MPAARRLTILLPGFLAFAAWWELRILLYRVHWERGPTVFLLLLLSIGLLLVVPRVARIVAIDQHHGGSRAPRRAGAIGLVLFAAAAVALWDDVRELPIELRKSEPTLIDIGGNTWAAAVRFSDFRENPYTHKTQLHPVDGAPGVVVEGDRVEMYGVPYYYGFPYFPAMFLSYAPFRWFERGQDSIRIGNAFWLAVLLAGTGWLAYRLAPEGRRLPAAALAILLLGATAGLGRQLFHYGITDLLIPTYVVCALVALDYRRPLAAGVLMGLAVAAKLLPGVLVAAVFFAWLARRDGFRPALAGFALTVAVVLLPFVAWGPAGFFSATILFYLTHHAAGDSTSAWYYLPGALRLPFLAVGGLATLGVVLWPLRSKSDDLRDLVRAMAVAGFLFVAFNKMVHLNYQFAVVPLACVALAADAMGPRVKRSRPEPSGASLAVR